ncbi:MAG: sulfite exporter TauE/SafE family protein [Cyclobacteriaceae bacterium]|nr:sulfite exporter TauE/SafE family protein [Cyclobacteriaceae bacterium]
MLSSLNLIEYVDGLTAAVEFIGYVAAIGIGLILGLLGGGGSILSIPVLVYLFQLDPVRASAYSLFVVGITSLIGAVPKYREGHVSLRTGLIFGIPSIVAIFITRKWFVPLLPDILITLGEFELTRRLLLLGLFAILMIGASWPMIRTQKVNDVDRPLRALPLALQGLLIGFTTGLVGAGGGFLIIPALIFLAGLPFKRAAGTSLFIIAANSLIGFVGDVLNFEMDWPFLLLITTLAIIGILVGNRLSRRLQNDTLRRSFGWFILVSGVYILFRELN